MSDTLAVLPQYLLPKKALTAFAGKIAGIQGGSWTTALIRWFVKRYAVNMAEAANPDIASYASFNEFLLARSKQVPVLWMPRPLYARLTEPLANLARLHKTRFFRPRGIAIPQPHWSVATRRWRRSFRTATLPPST